MLNVTQEVLDYTKNAYPNLYAELSRKDIWINLWPDGEYNLSYNSIKDPNTFLSDEVKDDFMQAMEELYPGSFWGDIVDIDACDNVTASTDDINSYSGYTVPEIIYIYYDGKLIDKWDINSSDSCENLYQLLLTDREAATDILNYMNSLGDPVFPNLDNWDIPETDISKIDIDELHGTFLKELYLDYSDGQPIYIDEGKFEIFSE